MLPHSPPVVVTRRAIIHLGAAGIGATLTLDRWQQASAHRDPRTVSNQALIMRLFAEAVNRRDETVCGELYESGALARALDPSRARGPSWAGLPGQLRVLQAMRLDVSVTVDDIVADGPLVAVVAGWHAPRPLARGTHHVGRTMHLFRLHDGLIWDEQSAGWDWLGEG